MDREALLAEFDMEIATTRRALERVTDDHLGWKPHEKSWTLGQLATHLSNIPMWGSMTMTTEGLDLETVPPEEPPASADAIRGKFEENVTACRAHFDAATPEDWGHVWRMTMGENEIMAMPRSPVIRSFILNHLIHHRAQLGVYLRLLDIPVPQMYGPTADEQ